MLNNNLALVTGGARGLGLAIAKKLNEHGAKVVVFDQDECALENLPSVFTKYLVDVTDQSKVQEAIHQLTEKQGAINILINNAGVIHSQPLINMMGKSDRVHNYEEYKKIIDLNMHSVFLMSSLVAENMIASRTKGVIVNISSVCALGNAGQSAYSAAKAGVNAFTRCWAKELGVFGIRVLAVAPGFIDTQSTQSALGTAKIDDLTKKVPLRRLGKDVDVANLVLSSVTNDYISGSILEVNGGFSL